MIVVLTVLVIVLAPVGAISANPTLFEIGVKHFVHLTPKDVGRVGTGATGEAGIGVAVSSIGARTEVGRQ
jgi:hypothetical protein